MSFTSSNGRSDVGELLRLDTLPVPIELRPMRSARRMRLHYDEVRRVLRMTCPASLSRRRALTWASEQHDWVLAQIARAGDQNLLRDGALVPLEGKEVRLQWMEGAARAPVIRDGVLIGGGPADSFGMRVERFLRDRALQLLSAETQEYAAKAGVTCRSVGVGDASSRWGSCSADGRIRYSWRLVMAPPKARRFVVAHEVAHLVHLNHGPKFKELEEQLFEGDVQAARALLRQVGPRLRRVISRL